MGIPRLRCDGSRDEVGTKRGSGHHQQGRGVGESEDRRMSGGYQERVGGESERGSEGGVRGVEPRR